MDINYKMLEIIKKFMIDTVYPMSKVEYNVEFIKFVFKEEDLEEIFSHLDLENIKIKASYNILKDNLNTYKQDDCLYPYIVIDNYKEFFMLLRNIYDHMLITKRDYKFSYTGLTKSIWLRMNVNDINNPNEFLKKQLSFLVFENYFEDKETFFKKYNDIFINYSSLPNDNYFETNEYLRLTLRYEDLMYNLPSIHYGILEENGELVCYIYGIQNIGKEIRCDEVKEFLREDRKYLRNSKVSPEFIITLKLMMDLLSEKGINKVKVPLLEVYNYPYHESLSSNIKENYELYSDEEKKLYEEMNDNKEWTDAVFDYLHNKKVYAKFVGKEDIISKNKTERLVDTFMIMEEKYGNIKFLSDPFIESDDLIIGIKKDKVKVKTMI